MDDFVKKGGTVADAQGRKCLCNGLVANIGLSQVRSNSEQELASMTAGDDVAQVARFLQPGCDTYTAADVGAACWTRPLQSTGLFIQQRIQSSVA